MMSACPLEVGNFSRGKETGIGRGSFSLPPLAHRRRAEGRGKAHVLTVHDPPVRPAPVPLATGARENS